MRVIEWAVERTSGVGVQEGTLNLLVAVMVRRRCVVGLLWIMGQPKHTVSRISPSC